MLISSRQMRMGYKIVCVIVLTALLLACTGNIGTAIAASLNNNAPTSCCSQCGQADNFSKGDCPLFLCLATNEAPAFVLPFSFETVYAYVSVDQLTVLPKEQFIFHPPKLNFKWQVSCN